MKKWTLILLVSLMALSFLVVPAAAKAPRTVYEGVGYCGDVEDAREWVSEGGVLHARDGHLACTTMLSDDRISGEEQLTVNYNFQFAPSPVFIYGPMWGKARVSNQDGYWEGIWVGERTKLEGYSYIRAVLRGYGDYAGLQARVDYIRLSPDPTAPYQVYGVIMEPGGK
jgi:hypothetical protein